MMKQVSKLIFKTGSGLFKPEDGSIASYQKNTGVIKTLLWQPMPSREWSMNAVNDWLASLKYALKSSCVRVVNT